MNLYFLVEGDETETQLYSSWVPHAFGGFTQIEDYQKAIDNNYFIISGGGYPQYLDRLRQSFENLEEVPSMYEHFFICIDSEEMSAEEKFAEVQEALTLSSDATKIRQKAPSLQTHIVIQHCCLETWFLGNQKVMSRNPTSTKLVDFKNYFDVLNNDPEEMLFPAGYVNKASFHLEYLKEMFREKKLRYSKSKPGCVLEAYYLEALRNRCSTTAHIPNLGTLLSIWDRIKG